MQTADIIAAASLFIAIVALAVALYALYRGNRNTSVATLVSLSEALRQAWDRLLPKMRSGEQHTTELADLMNLLETSCAIHLERSLAGVSKILMSQYLDDVLTLLIQTPALNDEVPALLQEENTFCHIKNFLNAKKESLSIAVPLAWYESYKK